MITPTIKQGVIMSTNSQIAFTHLGKTIAVAAACTAPTGVQAPVYDKFDPQNAGLFRKKA
jgi:hypothetical protein